MFVISHNTAFTYKDKRVDTEQMGRDLGVRYVLEGSVQRAGKQVRINTQLIDTETAAHLWAERFDRNVGDLFDLQNEITARIASALRLQLYIAESRRPTNSPDQWITFCAAARDEQSDLSRELRQGRGIFRKGARA